MSYHFRNDGTVEVRCPCGRPAEYVHRTQHFHGHGDIVVGGDYWHNEDERCKAVQK